MLYLHKPLLVGGLFKLGSVKITEKYSSLSSYHTEHMNFVSLLKLF